MTNLYHTIAATVTPVMLTQIGPLIAGAWARPDDDLGREIRGMFLIDTGAYGAMVDLDVAELLHLPLRGTKEIHGIHGYGQLQEYRAQLFLRTQDSAGHASTYMTAMECVGVPALRERNQSHGVDIIGILGRLFLQAVRLEIDGPSGAVSLTIAVAASGKVDDV
jgi:hypothetical protein